MFVNVDDYSRFTWTIFFRSEDIAKIKLVICGVYKDILIEERILDLYVMNRCLTRSLLIQNSP